MANNILEQLEELYSRWSMADKVGKEMQLEGMWQLLSSSYSYLYQIYQQRGYLTTGEANYTNQISQVLRSLQSEKMKVDQDLANEMMKHLVKMMAKQNNQ